MSGTTFYTAVEEKILPSVTLPIWFNYYLYEALHEIVETPANIVTKANASSLPQEEIDVLVNELIPELTAFDLKEASDFVPAYYANTGELIAKLIRLLALANDGAPNDDLAAFLDLYRLDQSFNFSDEDTYQVPAALVRALLKYETGITTGIDFINAP